MDVSLTPELERLVEEKVSSGLYSSASEVIQEALRLLDERDHLQKLRLQQLRQEITAGIEAADKGALVSGQEVFQELRQRTDTFAKRKK